MSDNGFSQSAPSGNSMIDGIHIPRWCPECSNTGRVWQSRENMACWIEDVLEETRMIYDHEFNVKRLERVMQVLIEWWDDHCIPCSICQ